MQLYRYFWVGAAALTLAGMLAYGAQPPPPPATEPAPAATPTQPVPAAATPATQPSLNTWIDAVRTASDPSAAVEAYSHGLAMDPRSVPLAEAYIRRMTAFGMPQMVTRTAASLAELQPGNGLAAAVLAYSSAQRGDMSSAFAQISQAVTAAPEEPFVQATAGQLVAWYDHNQYRENITTSMKSNADQVRQAMAGKPPFTGAYQQSLAALRNQATQNNADAAPPMPPEYSGDYEDYNQPATDDTYDYGGYSTSGYGGYSYPPYLYPNYPYSYYDYYPYYPYYNYSYYPYGYGSAFLPYFFFKHRPRDFHDFGRFHHFGKFDRFGKSGHHSGKFDHRRHSRGDFDGRRGFRGDSGFGSSNRPFTTGRSFDSRRSVTPDGTFSVQNRFGRDSGTVIRGRTFATPPRAGGSRTFTSSPRTFGGRSFTSSPRTGGGRSFTASPRSGGGRSFTASPRGGGGRSFTASPRGGGGRPAAAPRGGGSRGGGARGGGR